MDGERKLQVVLDGRIYVELEGNAATVEDDIAAFAKKIDLAAVAKIK